MLIDLGSFCLILLDPLEKPLYNLRNIQLLLAGPILLLHLFEDYPTLFP
jgi:hypothetical protein